MSKTDSEFKWGAIGFLLGVLVGIFIIASTVGRMQEADPFGHKPLIDRGIIRHNAKTGDLEWVEPVRPLNEESK